MKNSIKNKKRNTFGQLHHNPGLGGLTIYDHRKTNNPIKSKHRHINSQER